MRIFRSHLDKAGPRCGRDIAPVEKAVQISPDLLLLAQLEQGEKVLDVAVNAAVGQKAEQVDGAAGLLRMVDGAEQSGIAVKIAVGNLF